jgi:hypothetical protein
MASFSAYIGADLACLYVDVRRTGVVLSLAKILPLISSSQRTVLVVVEDCLDKY